MPDQCSEKIPKTRDSNSETDGQKDLLNPNQNESTEETIKRAEKHFALDLPLLVDETARDIKILNAIAGIEKQQLDSIFYPYRPHRLHLSTRIGLLFSNDKIVIPENMRTTITDLMAWITVTSQLQKWTNQPKLSGGLACTENYKKKRNHARIAGPQVRTLLHKSRQRKKNILEILTEPNQEIQLDFAGPIKSETRGDVYILVAINRFSEWPTAQICKSTERFKIFNKILRG